MAFLKLTGSTRRLRPFVPVGPGERTALYSHRELCALAGVDSRNELEALSEPMAQGPQSPRPEGGIRFSGKVRLLLGLLAGAAAGAVLTAMFTPRSGAGLRLKLKSFTRRTRRRVGSGHGAVRCSLGSGSARKE